VAGVSRPIIDIYKERSGVDINYLPPIIPFIKSIINKEDLKENLGFKTYDKIVLYVGSIKPLKAPKVLLSAFDNLGVALEDGRLSEAFEFAHALKGIVGNMGLTPMFNIVCDIVEPLRINSNEGVKENYKELLSLREKFTGFIS
jgi:glycosyltransferase involved in cell wall biosynthesis